MLEIEARIVSAGMKELGIEELEEMSQCIPDQIESWTKARKKEFLDELSIATPTRFSKNTFEANIPLHIYIARRHW